MLTPEALAHGLDMLDLYARAAEGCALDAEYGCGPWHRGEDSQNRASRQTPPQAQRAPGRRRGDPAVR